MSARRLSGADVRHALLIAVDALTYAFAVVLTGAVLTFLIAIGAGGDLVLVKRLLFVCGWLLVTVATIQMWPRSPDELGSGQSIPADPDAQSRFQRFVAALPPLRWVELRLRPTERLSIPMKRFLGGVGLLVASLVLELGGVT